jgi:CheY-like chemotaxis protein
MGGDAPQEGPADGPPPRAATGDLVLVVDDEPEVRAWVGRVLDRAGIPSVIVASGKEALRLVLEDRVRPATVVTDIEMPGMTGIELAARLLAARPGIRVVMMTGDPERAAAARDRTTIVATVLLKPIEMADLLAAVGPADDDASASGAAIMDAEQTGRTKASP